MLRVKAGAKELYRTKGYLQLYPLFYKAVTNSGIIEEEEFFYYYL